MFVSNFDATLQEAVSSGGRTRARNFALKGRKLRRTLLYKNKQIFEFNIYVNKQFLYLPTPGWEQRGFYPVVNQRMKKLCEKQLFATVMEAVDGTYIKILIIIKMHGMSL